MERGMVNYWFNIPCLPRWFGISTILNNLALATIVMAIMSTAFAPFAARDMDVNHQGAGGDYVVNTQSGGTNVHLPFEWRLGSAARTRSTQRTSPVISIFQWHVQRMIIPIDL